MGFCCQSGIISGLSIRRNPYKSTRPPGHTELRLCSAPGVRVLQAWEKRTCKFLPQGNSLRRVSQCGTGWSRNSTSPGFSPGSKSKASANLIFPAARDDIRILPLSRQSCFGLRTDFRPSLCDCRDARIACRVCKILLGLFVRWDFMEMRVYGR